MSNRVAIIGAAHRFPGTTPETFWQDLQAEKDLVTRVAEDRWSHEAFQHPERQHPGTSVTFAAGSLGDISGFDAGFFGISPREASHMDPQQRLLLELAWEAIEDAGVVPASLRGSRCGVFVGIASIDYAYRLADDLEAIGPSSATGNTSSIASNRLSYLFDLRGPSMSVDTACSSSLVAFHQACQAIRSGETEMALAGGISLHLHPYGFIIFTKASMLSANGRCRVFDEAGDGYVRSEGAGLFLLKDYDRALADGDRILAVVAGSAVNTDGHKSGLTVPNASAQVTLMREAYERAGISPDEIDYLEAHGTGTAVGDPIETRAIGEALARHRTRPLPIGSVKSNVGHLETASGVAGLAKALYSLRHREVPATIGIRRLNPRIQFDEWNLKVVTRAQPLKAEGRLVIGVNSFGFGGANAHVILESPPSASAAPNDASAADGRHVAGHSPESPGPLPLQLSARGEPALRAMAGRLAEWLKERDDALYDIAYSLRHHREHHSDGALLMVEDRQDAIARLGALADPEAAHDPRIVRGEHLPGASAPAFIYAGNGCQWETMGAELLARSPVFAAAVEEVDALFQRHGDFSLRAELEGRNGVLDNGASRLTLTEVAQPALFAVQVGLTRLLRHHGIAPAAVAGHSVGEVAAAWACGALSLADAVRVIHYRSHYQGKTRGQGEMTAVALGEADTRALLDSGDYPGIHLAGINSSKGVTLAGEPAALERLEATLAQQGTFAKRLPLDYAFHSPAMDPIQEGVIEALAGLVPQPATISYVSTVTGDALAAEALDAEYWWHNIRQPVRFDAAIKALIDAGSNVFVEIGAHPILRRYLGDALRDRERPGRVIGTLEREQPAEACVHQAIGQVLLSGAPCDLRHWFPVSGRRVELPRYPWQRERFWVKGTAGGQGLLNRYYEHPLLGYRLAQQPDTWESQLDTGRLPWLADHVVGEGAVFPGAGFVELALAAGRHARDTQVIDVEELEIRAPLLLDAQHGRRMRLHLAPADGRIEIRSREPLAEGEWQLNAVARVMQQSRGFLLRREAPALPSRAPDLELGEHLALAERLGLRYGPAFQAIARTWVEADSVIGEIAPTDAIVQTRDTLHLHPGILDSAFQLFIPLLAREAVASGQEDAGLAFVPVRIGRLQFLADGGPPTLAHARILKRAPHSFTADFELFDAQGRAVAVLSETRFRAIRLKRHHHQRFSYLDVQLTPAPRRGEGQGLDLTPLHAAVAQLADTYRRHTGGRLAEEVDPLLDSLADAFAAELLHSLAGGQRLSQARYHELTRRHLDAQRLLDQLLHQLQGAGRLERDDQGWRLVAADDDIPAATIWQLLVRDYPDHFAPVQRLGRFGLHLPALLDGREDAATLGLDADALAALCRQLPGAAGWQAIAEGLREALPRVVAALPSGQRLRLLEAGPAAPSLSERLCDLLDADRCDLGLLAVGESARHQAEQLQERFPLIDLETLEAGDPPLPPAQLALVGIEVGHRERTRRLLQALPERLAPNAQLLLVGTHPSGWLDSLLATPGLADDGNHLHAISAQDVARELEAIGATDIGLIPLEGDDRGLYLMHATWERQSQTSASSAALAPVTLLADSHTQGLAEHLAAALRERGRHVTVARGLEEHEGSPAAVVDLRQNESRCNEAMTLARALEPRGSEASLWLITRGVASMWCDTTPNVGAGFIRRWESAGAADMQAAESRDESRSYDNLDAALWGFGRSLANESTGYPVRLLDLPEEEPGEALIAALAEELTAPDAETEIVLDAQGQRFATRLRTLPAPSPEAPAGQDDRQAMTLGFELPGQLRHLSWTPRPLPAPGPGEVEVRVKATGLNFRDVMYT
ncbi:beta-ketoacyl synthase N-terminal-like domain-containing protein, partial [Halomonas sp. BM-2019]|uniref:type I polyketide synthase n=1 Tax=Halomonas sp. BM-2019 TaxID=2811227 RepID=UPI001B3C320D